MDVGGSPYNCVSHREEVLQPQYPRDPQFALGGWQLPFYSQNPCSCTSFTSPWDCILGAKLSRAGEGLRCQAVA